MYLRRFFSFFFPFPAGVDVWCAYACTRACACVRQLALTTDIEIVKKRPLCLALRTRTAKHAGTKYTRGHHPIPSGAYIRRRPCEFFNNFSGAGDDVSGRGDLRIASLLYFVIIFVALLSSEF